MRVLRRNTRIFLIFRTYSSYARDFGHSNAS